LVLDFFCDTIHNGFLVPEYRVPERIQIKIRRADIQSPPRWRTTVSGAVHFYYWCPWFCLLLDCALSVADLSRLPPLKSRTLHRNTSSQLPRCPSGVAWNRFYCNNLSTY